MVPTHQQIQPTTDSCTIVFTTEKNSAMSGPTQYKLVLFKGQLISI